MEKREGEEGEGGKGREKEKEGERENTMKTVLLILFPFVLNGYTP